MAFNNLEVQKLVNNSIQFKNGMTAVWPNRDYMRFEVKVNFRFSEFNGCFSKKDGVLGFVLDNILYITPAKKKIVDVLVKAGFEETTFQIPFSNEDYPKNEEEKWNELMKS